jgi:hypothetical protein
MYPVFLNPTLKIFFHSSRFTSNVSPAQFKPIKDNYKYCTLFPPPPNAYDGYKEECEMNFISTTFIVFIVHIN